jgi:hypothetical protein
MENLKAAFDNIIQKHKQIVSHKKSLIKKLQYGIVNFETIHSELNHISEEHFNPVLLTESRIQEIHELKKEILKQFLEYCRSFKSSTGS